MTASLRLSMAFRRHVKPFLTRPTKWLSFRHDVANLPHEIEARWAQGAACRHYKQPKEAVAWLLFGFWREGEIRPPILT